MKLLFKIILFAIFFNISTLMVAAMNIFPAGTILYGDVIYNATDPNHLPSADTMFSNLINNTEIPIIGHVGQIGFAALVLLIFGVGIVLTWITKDPKIIAAMLVGTLFYMMYCNSKSFIENLSKNTGPLTGYIVLMVSLGVIILFLITLMDYLTTQSNEE